MTELQNKILEGLGSTTQSGVEDLSEAQFVETEIRSVKSSLKSHPYLTLFFIVIFISQLFNQLLKAPSQRGVISMLFLFIGWIACLTFFYNWVAKKKRLALLKLLLDTYNQSANIELWIEDSKNQFSGWLWRLTVSKSKYLSELEKKRQTKLMFFITNLVLIISFTISAINGSDVMVYGAPAMMILAVLTFLDWQIHSYYFVLSNLQYYDNKELSVSL